MANLKKYEFEVNSILSKIDEFRDGIGTKKTAENLRHEFIELLDKIGNDKPEIFNK